MDTKYIYKNTITIEIGKRSGKPCIRGMRIAVADILQSLASGQTVNQIIEDFPELSAKDIFIALEFAAKQMQTINYIAA
jgi:uncharacterized protein (DUF433 family)